MIDVSNLGGDFMPRQRPEDRFAQGGQQPFTPPQVPRDSPPGGGMQFGGQQPFTPVGEPQMQPPGAGTTQWGGGGQVSTGQQQPFAPGVPPPDAGPPTQFSSIARPDGMPGQPPTGGVSGGAGTSVSPGEGGFPYPEQWQQAGDIYGQLAGGMPGMPDPGAMWGGYQQQAGDLSRELAEQAGMGVGSRYGSSLQRNIADVGMRAGERFGGEMERMRMGDIQGQRQAMLGAAGGLSGLGGAQAMLPGQLAGQAMGLGGQYQGMQQQEYDRQRQEWLRQQPEYSPYLPYQQQGSQVPYGPQTYQPGFASNMMDIGGMMGMYGMMGRG